MARLLRLERTGHAMLLTLMCAAQIILEEAAYCDPGLIAEVVVPLLSMQQSVLLCISTILDSGNHYTKMMELVDDLGFKVFETINITLVRTTILCQNVYSTLCLWIVVRRCATTA